MGFSKDLFPFLYLALMLFRLHDNLIQDYSLLYCISYSVYIPPYVYTLYLVYVLLYACFHYGYVPSVCMSLRGYVLSCHLYDPSMCVSSPCICFSVCLFLEVSVFSVFMVLLGVLYTLPCIHSAVCTLLSMYVRSSMSMSHRVYTPRYIHLTGYTKLHA